MGSITMNDAAESMASVRNLHITGRIRLARDNSFECVAPDDPFQPVDIWKVFGKAPRWRVQHPGRAVITDGAHTLLQFPRPNGAIWCYQFPASDSMFAGCLLAPLLDIEGLFAGEQQAARSEGAQVSLQEKSDASGAPLLVLTITARAQGDYRQSDYMRNKSLPDSDNTRVYTFDAATHRLRNMCVYMDIDGVQVLVFEITAIHYNTEIDPALFNANVPEGARLLEFAEQGEMISNNTAATPKGRRRDHLQSDGPARLGRLARLYRDTF